MKAKDTVKRNPFYRCLEYDHDQGGELCLVACGIERCDPGISYGPEVRDCYHLHAVLSGSGTLCVGGQELHPAGGQLFLLKDNEEVMYTAGKKDPWRYCWVTYTGSQARQISQEIGFTDGIYCMDSTVDINRFYDLVMRMHEKPEMNYINDLRRKGILLEYLSLAMEATQNPSLRNSRRYSFSKEDYMRRAERFIELNYASSIRINDIAAYIGFSRSYFTTLFKEYSGLSPQEYLLRCRMTHSCHLLEYTALSIYEVSTRVGYDDSLAFSRIFKKYYGCSPAAYRKRLSGQS